MKRILMLCALATVLDCLALEQGNFFLVQFLDDYHQIRSEENIDERGYDNVLSMRKLQERKNKGAVKRSLSNGASRYGAMLDKAISDVALEDELFDDDLYYSRYTQLFDEALDHSFFTQILINHSFDTDQAYDDCKNRTNLANLLFEKWPIYLSDIYVPARLAKCGLLEPPAGSSMCAEDLCDQFLGQLADLELNFFAKQQRTTIDITLAYRYIVEQKLQLLLGLNIPIVHEARHLDLELNRGGLSNAEFNDAGTSLQYFFKEFSSVRDFVTGFVFGDCKEFCYQPYQSRMSIGDMAFFAALDFGRYINEDLQITAGLNILVPTARGGNGDTMWEIDLGSDGRWTLNPFVTFDYSYSDYINPHLSVAGFFKPSHNGAWWIPEKLTNTSDINASVSGLCFPSVLECYTIKPFECIVDSCVSAFADRSTCVRIRPGHGAFFRMGNNFYNIFGSPIEFGAFYLFNIKMGAVFEILCQDRSDDTRDNPLRTATFQTGKLPETRTSSAHQIQWRLAQRVSEHVGWAIGSMHVIGGKNVVKTNNFFAKLALYF